MRKFKNKWKRLGTLDKCLAFCASLIVITLVYAMIIFAVKGEEPDSILDFIKTLCGAEGIITASIAIYKIKKGKDDENT